MTALTPKSAIAAQTKERLLHSNAGQSHLLLARRHVVANGYSAMKCAHLGGSKHHKDAASLEFLQVVWAGIALAKRRPAARNPTESHWKISPILQGNRHAGTARAQLLSRKA